MEKVSLMKYDKSNKDSPRSSTMRDIPERLLTMRNHCIGLGAEVVLQLASMSPEEKEIVVDHVVHMLVNKPADGEYFLPTSKCREILSNHLTYVDDDTGKSWSGLESRFRNAMTEMGEWSGEIFMDVWTKLDIIEPVVKEDEITFIINVANLKGEPDESGD